MHAKQLYADHHYLNFWLWATLHEGEVHLTSSRDLSSRMGTAQNGEERAQIMQMFTLTGYRFVSALGVALRYLERLQHVFPSIKSAYDKANHLRAEGKNLRDMILHIDDYTAGRGRKQMDFLRKDESQDRSLPGDSSGILDASATIISNGEIWMGGRLNVERAIIELRPLVQAAKDIPPPDF